MRFLILLIFLTNNVFAKDVSEIKNIVIHKDLKVYDNVIFLDKNDKKINIKEFNGNLLLLNFWATWCAPCKKELPLLDKLANSVNSKQLNIVLINLENKKYSDVKSFLDNLGIKNLTTYFDKNLKLTRSLGLRGVPVTLVVNSDKKEVARILGDIDFNNEEFVNWIKSF